MNDTQRARLAMLQTALGVLDEYAAVFATNKALVKAHGELATLVNRLDPTADRQRKAVTPAEPGLVKKKTRVLLAERGGLLAAAVRGLADELDDDDLHAHADYTEKQLLRQPDADLLRITKNLDADATLHATALADQEVTSQELADFRTALLAFKTELNAPRLTIATGKALKKAINADLGQGVRLLRNRIDQYMVRYQKTQPVFYTAYKSARQEINTAARHDQPGTPPPAA